MPVLPKKAFEMVKMVKATKKCDFTIWVNVLLIVHVPSVTFFHTLLKFIEIWASVYSDYYNQSTWIVDGPLYSELQANHLKISRLILSST